MIEMRKTNKPTICFSESLFKGCNAFPQCNSMIFEWFRWFLSFLLLIFNLKLTFQEIWSKWGKHLYASESLFKGCNVFPQCNSMIFEWFSWFPIIPVTNFQFVTNISGGYDRNEENTYMLLNHFSKVVMYFRNAILWFLSGLVDSLSFLLLIFNLWLTFQEIWSKWGKSNKNTYMLLNHFLKVVMHIRNAILWFWVV